jgi:hypothetical protein
MDNGLSSKLLLSALVLCCCFFKTGKALNPGPSPDTQENLKFKLLFNGFNSATAYSEITSYTDPQGQKFIKSKWSMRSKPVFRLLFYVNNIYESVFDIQNNTLVRIQKEVEQKNLTQKMAIRYHWDQMTAETDSGLRWPVKKGTMDIFSLLYLLRTSDFKVGDSCHFIVDFESLLFDVTGCITGPVENSGAMNEKATFNIELHFNTIEPLKARSWKTDLLTNRLGKPGTVLVMSLGPAPDKLPYSILFKKDNSTVEMRLER